MTYTIRVEPANYRKQIISEKAEALDCEKISLSDVYEDREVVRPLVNLPIHIPIYRMANGRTQSEQRLAISDENLPSNYFSENQENVEAQQKQHSILVRAARDGVTNRIKPIIDVLTTDNQKEPILISPEGVVLNGNRRLAAMRELLASDSETYKRFSTVKAAVLPQLTPEEEQDIEVRLQMTPLTKLDYSWVDQGLMIQHYIQVRGFSTKDVAKKLGWSEKKVKQNLVALQEGEAYLANWLEGSRDFHKILNKKQFFFDQNTNLENKTGALREATRKLSWAMLSRAAETEDIEGRFYDLNHIFRDKVPQIVKEVNGKFPLIESQKESIDDEFSFDSNDEDLMLKRFAEIMDNSPEREKLRQVTLEVVNEFDEQHQLEDSGKSPLEHLKKAHKSLSIVNINHASQDSLEQIRGQMISISEILSDLSLLLNKRLKK
jgi:hypothetical protein